MFWRNIRLIGLFALTIPGIGYSQSPVVLDGSFESLMLGTQAEVLEDPEGQWTLADTLDPSIQKQFVRTSDPILSVGFTQSVYWVRFVLENPLSHDQEWLLDYPFRTMDQIELYRPLPSGEYQMTRVGDVFPLANRDVPHDHFLFNIQVPADQTLIYYLRADSHGGAMVVPLKLVSPVTFIESSKPESAMWGFTFGLLGILVAYSLFQYISARDRGHLYYALAMFAVAIAYLMLNGWGNYFFWGSIDLPVNNWLPHCWTLGLYALLQYFRSLLDTGRWLPRMDMVLKFLGYSLVGIFGGLFVIPYGTGVQLVNLVLLAGLVLGATASLLRYRQRYEPALYPLLGALAMILSAAVNMLRISYGQAPAGGLDMISIAGFWVEALMLSFALSSRYKLLRVEKEKIQAEKLQIQGTLVSELKRADQLKDDFLANTSHELRTPLHGIIGLCEAMGRRDFPQSEGERQRKVDLIANSARRLAYLVNDILDFSRLKSEDLRLNHRDFDLRGPVQLACALCEISIGQKPVKLIQDLPEAPFWVRGDEERIQQVLFNLLGNAIKFTHQGEVRISVSREVDGVRVSVMDTGIGIAAEKREEIFKPFVQADGSITREYGGTGLGLAISRQLVTLHGSELDLESILGRGSTFSFRLQAADPVNVGEAFDKPVESRGKGTDFPEAVEVVHSGPVAESPENAALILVVDDEPLNVEVVKSQLSQEGYQIRSAMDGIEALEVLRKETPALILLDLMMPRMNGYEVCQKIRESLSPVELPVIMLTARGQMEDLVRGLQAGANDYLTKPFYREELLARIRSQLAQRSAADVLRENERLSMVVREISRTEASLKRSERRLARILERSKESLLVIDEEGLIVYCSQAMEAVLEVSAGSILRRPLVELVVGAIPPPLENWPPEETVWDSVEFPLPVGLSRQSGKPWLARMWGAELDLDEQAWIFSFVSSDENGLVAPPSTAQWAQSVGVNRSRLQRLIEIFQELPTALVDSKPEMLHELASIDQALESLERQVDPDVHSFEALVVQVMNDAVACWESATRKSVIELAEESGIWAVNIDDGRLRARSMERYLDVGRLPQKPRWRNVLRTGHFVLTHAEKGSPMKERLEQSLQALLQAVHQRNLSAPVAVPSRD